MARERYLEGDGIEESSFSDVELDDDGNPIDDGEGEEEEEEEGEDGDGGSDEDRGDSVLDDDDDPDLDALGTIAGDDNPTVPRGRLNDVIAERDHWRNLAQGLAQRGGGEQTQRREQEQQAPAFDLKAKLKERADAILEGDTDKIVALDEEIENYRNTTVRTQGEQAGRAAAAAAYQQERMNEIVEAAFQRYPFLNDANAEFSKEALGDVLMYKARYQEEGDSPSAALKKAVNRVCPYYAEELDPDSAGKGGKKGAGKAARGGDGARDPNQRDPKKIQRNARAGNRIPPGIGRAGTGSSAGRRALADRGAKEVPNSEYRQMSEEEKKRLRGDYVSG